MKHLWKTLSIIEGKDRGWITDGTSKKTVMQCQDCRKVITVYDNALYDMIQRCRGKVRIEQKEKIK